jgi:uncharacterized alpha/beta hydrolase family protein
MKKQNVNDMLILTFLLALFIGYIITKDQLDKHDSKKNEIEKEQNCKQGAI